MFSRKSCTKGSERIFGTKGGKAMNKNKKWLKKGVALAMASLMCVSVMPGETMIMANDNTGDAKTADSSNGVYQVEVDANGNIVADNATSLENQSFTWDNANVYFVLTDRFKNSDKSNDHSYGRGLQADGKTAVEGLDTYTNPGTFHGGDLNGLTEKVEDGYFTDLGVNAIWITAPYEQIHGYTSGNVQSNNVKEYPDEKKGGFPYYSYHGYWTLDYSNIDANMGTEQDFANFVDSCHKKGIRVVMDVVMNHVGYTTMQDAQDYGFDGVLKNCDMAKWKDYYYGNSTYLMGGDPEAVNFWDAESAIWKDKWWGPAFVRASYPGYTKAGGDDTHMSLCGLPDVITESTATEGSTPPILLTKWKKEGRLEKEQKELDDFFSTTGYKKQARYYIIKWLTDYVREYGVDGFRCDTAKHVDLDAWKDLKTESVKALKEWRQNNPTKAGAKWTDDFWMTGEAWGHGVGKSAYYTSGGFDSMINFSFPKDGNLVSLEGTYSTYAEMINTDPEFNALSYVASHDDSAGVGVFEASAAKSKNLGTSLLLAPGAVQTYYGNEVNRQIGWKNFFTGSDYLDQRYRTDMDWDAISSNSETKDVLAHWQKVGTFRNKHASVGAGQHTKLADAPYTFSRTYNLEEENEDKVVCALPGAAGTYDVVVGDVFEDGETVTDYYSGEKYQVSGGSVSVKCDAAGVILLEGSGIVKPSVSIKSTIKTEKYSVESFNVTLKANKVKDPVYQINDGSKIAFTSGDTITIGGTAYGEATKITVSGVSEEDGTELTKTVTYTKIDEPEVNDLALCVKVKKSDAPNAPNIWLYTSDKEEKSLVKAAWPGDKMVQDDDADYWSYSVDDYEGEAKVILIIDGKSNKGTGAPGDVVQGTVVYDKATGTYTKEAAGEVGKVTINYVDSDGEVLKSIYRVGVLGKKYTTSAAIIDGYTLDKTPENATGVIEKDTVVTYVYTKSSGVTKTKKPTETTAPATTDTVSTTKPQTTETVTQSTTAPNDSAKEAKIALSVSKSSPQTVGTTITISANMENTTDNYQYIFSVTNNKTKKVTEIQNFYSSNSKVTWKPTVAGNYTITACAKSENGKNVIIETKAFKVSAAKFTLNTFTVTSKSKTIKIKANITPSSGTAKYKFVVTKGKKKIKTLAYTTKGNRTLKVKKAGTYKVTMYAKDKTTTIYVTKTVKVK